MLAGGGVFVIEPLVRLHDLAYLVDGRQQLAERGAAEEDVQICILAVFLHGADVRPVGVELLALLGLGLFELAGLFLHQRGVERDLLVDELDLLAGELVLRVQRGLLLKDAGPLGLQLVDAGLHAGPLGLQLFLLGLDGVYLALVLLADGVGPRGAYGDERQGEGEHRRQDDADDLYS